MDGRGEQPGLTPGGGAGRSENPQGGPEEGYRGEPALQVPYRGGTALQGGQGSAEVVPRGGLQGRQAFLIAADVTWE